LKFSVFLIGTLFPQNYTDFVFLTV
jgi:hypothetical protein